MSKIILKEIIWEITTECNNGCSYCGSRSILNSDEDQTDSNICILADKIAEYPPKEIDISGGDPLLVSLDVHKYITSLFKSKGILCKILINPLSFINSKCLNSSSIDKYQNIKLILDLYDWIGISINTEKELELFEEFRHLFKDNITFITNFNLSNIFLIDKFMAVFKKQSTPTSWQVQYTMYKDTSQLNLCYHPLAITKLEAWLNAVNVYDHINIVAADNANCAECGAGISSLGVLANGNVIPCLSMRSWLPYIVSEFQGNLFKDDLKGIWESKFKSYRFGNDAPVCKKHKLPYRYLPLHLKKKELDYIIPTPVYGVDMTKVRYPIPDMQVAMYAVMTDTSWSVSAPISGDTITFVQKDKDK